MCDLNTQAISGRYTTRRILLVRANSNALPLIEEATCS
jgi:hypothetical protein